MSVPSVDADYQYCFLPFYSRFWYKIIRRFFREPDRAIFREPDRAIFREPDRAISTRTCHEAKHQT